MLWASGSYLSRRPHTGFPKPVRSSAGEAPGPPDQGISGIAGAQSLFARFGIAESRLTLEPAARNIAEHAGRTRDLLGEFIARLWIRSPRFT